jgi:hypothetical protein
MWRMGWTTTMRADLVSASFVIGPILALVALGVGALSILVLVVRSLRNTPARTHSRRVLAAAVGTPVTFVALYWIGDHFLFWDPQWQFWQDTVLSTVVLVIALAAGAFAAVTVWRTPPRGWSVKRALARDLMATGLTAWILVWSTGGSGFGFGGSSRLYVAILVGLLAPPTIAFAGRAIRMWTDRSTTTTQSTDTGVSRQILVLVALAVCLAGMWGITPRTYVAPAAINFTAMPTPEDTTFEVRISYRGCANGAEPTERDFRSLDVDESDETIVLRAMVRYPPTLGGYTCPAGPPSTLSRVVELDHPLGAREVLVDTTFWSDESEMKPVT